LPQIGSASEFGFKLGVASYSFRQFQRTAAIRMIKQLNTPYVSVKEVHLRYADPPAQIEAGCKEFTDAGLRLMSGGNVTMSEHNPVQLRRYFEYARNAKLPMLVCAPTRENLGMVEQLVKEYDIRIAIHNHGPADPHFPMPQSVLAVVSKMDRRCGLCMDLGHSAEAGVDVVKSLAEAGDRLFDVHIKDVLRFSNPAGRCDIGDGVMPIAAIFRQLRKIRYTGCVNMEQEANAEDPLPGMIKSFAYMRGVLAALRD
jgi:sugar phosphate isomerase/epimerase